MFEGEWSFRFSVGLPNFGKLIETIHDYVWEGEEDE